MACKHCEEGFNSNNKLHEHVRWEHARRPASPPKAPRAPLRAPQPSILASKTWQTSTFDAPSTPPSTPPAAPRKFVETLGHRLKEEGDKHVNLSLTPPASPLAPRTPLHAPQSTLLPPKALPPPILQTPPIPPPTPPHTPGLRHQPTNHVTKRLPFKPYMTIDDLYIMFHEKPSRKSVITIQKRVLSPMPDQARIIDYFRPVALASSVNSNCKPSTPSTSQSARALPNRKPEAPHMTIDEIASLRTQRRLKAPISALPAKSNRFEIDQACTSANQRPRSPQAQGPKQSSNTSNPTSLQSITPSSALRVNQPIRGISARALSSSITPPSRTDLLRALIRATITQLAPLLNPLRQAATSSTSLRLSPSFNSCYTSVSLLQWR